MPHCQPVRYDFRYGLPDGAAFPHETWRRLLARWARAVSVQELHYGPPEGYAPLRQAIASYLHGRVPWCVSRSRSLWSTARSKRSI